MQKMTLGSYTFWRNPDQFSIPKQVRHSAVVKTYGGTAFFSWGLFYGQSVLLEWEWMDSSAFASLQSLLEDDEEKVWVPQTGTSYDVEILKLDGVYSENSQTDAPWRKSVKLSMLVKGTA